MDPVRFWYNTRFGAAEPPAAHHAKHAHEHAEAACPAHFAALCVRAGILYRPGVNLLWLRFAYASGRVLNAVSEAAWSGATVAEVLVLSSEF